MYLIIEPTHAPRDGAPRVGAPRVGAPRDGAPRDGAPSDGTRAKWPHLDRALLTPPSCPLTVRVL